MDRLSREFGFYFQSHNVQSAAFNHDAIDKEGKRLLALSDSDHIEWDHFPSYQGSHFIRDPRDLVVSGYYYHLWTDEAWCIRPTFKWNPRTAHSLFHWVESDPAQYPRDISYQAYLHSLDHERGLMMEMIFREPTFQQMRQWNYHNPRILEMRYEEIVGNEKRAFGRLFEHYGFHRRLRARGLDIVNALSLKHQPTGEAQHSRKGSARQWADEFTPRLKDIFKEAHGDLLMQLGYERDLNW